MTDTRVVKILDHQVSDAARALDLAATALIRAQELAEQDTSGIAPVRLADAQAALRSRVRLLADMLESPQSAAPSSPALGSAA